MSTKLSFSRHLRYHVFGLLYLTERFVWKCTHFFLMTINWCKQITKDYSPVSFQWFFIQQKLTQPSFMLPIIYVTMFWYSLVAKGYYPRNSRIYDVTCSCGFGTDSAIIKTGTTVQVMLKMQWEGGHSSLIMGQHLWSRAPAKRSL